MKLVKLILFAALVGSVAIVGCGDDETATGGTGGGTAGTGGGTAGNGGNGGGNGQVVEVFVTSGTFDGDFGDQAGGDTECTNAATAAGLTGTWIAWLGRGSCGACEHPVDRIPDGEYQLLDGTVVANDKADLTDGTLDAAISLTENDTMLDAGNVWTGTTADGEGGGVGTCTVWTTNDAGTRARVGDPIAVDQTWSDVGEGDPNTGGLTCDTLLHLYCFSAP
jgi:hypothetical protein